MGTTAAAAAARGNSEGGGGGERGSPGGGGCAGGVVSGSRLRLLHLHRLCPAKGLRRTQRCQQVAAAGGSGRGQQRAWVQRQQAPCAACVFLVGAAGWAGSRRGEPQGLAQGRRGGPAFMRGRRKGRRREKRGHTSADGGSRRRLNAPAPSTHQLESSHIRTSAHLSWVLSSPAA